MNTENNKIVKESKSSKSSFHEWYDSILRALVFILILLSFSFRVCTVEGDSMNNTLYDDEQLVLFNLFYTPKENDVIVFHQTGDHLNEPCVKRVIATGGKWVKIDYDTRTLYVSDDDIFNVDDIVDESSYAYFSNGRYNATGTLIRQVPDGYLFVMGDNRNNSTDSRSPLIDLVHEKTVLGKVVFRTSPSDKFGFVK